MLRKVAQGTEGDVRRTDWEAPQIMYFAASPLNHKLVPLYNFDAAHHPLGQSPLPLSHLAEGITLHSLENDRTHGNRNTGVKLPYKLKYRREPGKH